jgi:hypothetical protein
VRDGLADHEGLGAESAIFKDVRTPSRKVAAQFTKNPLLGSTSVMVNTPTESNCLTDVHEHKSRRFSRYTPNINVSGQ